MKSHHDMPFGAQCRGDDGTLFRLWSPDSATVQLEWQPGRQQSRRVPMTRRDGGWHEHTEPDAPAGTRYRFVLPSGLAVPDPAARYAPDDVHAASEVIDPCAYAWRDTHWRGRPWHEAVIYELHVGVFTPEGTFKAAQQRLRELAELGITAIELMPVASFPGRRGWGYDGVALFAPEAGYGRPDDLKAFVDEAHALGLMVLLDVVYNHFGPEGNYLHAISPQFFSAAHSTPWGPAINFDGPNNATVRDFFRHNALFWVEEYHFDGLRLDAVHAIRDDSAIPIVTEIAQALRTGPGRERAVHLVLENERNEAHRLVRDAQGAPCIATAQWNDDLHHAAHVALTGETEGYYADFADRPVALFACALAEGYVFQGQPSPLRDGAAHGEPSTGLPGTAFVSFVQNHDQIGNRALGERLHMLCGHGQLDATRPDVAGLDAAQPDAVRLDAARLDGARLDAARLDAVYACLLLSPHVPMLFCGEEFAASTPFNFFCDFGPDLAQAVSDGRRAEFARFPAFNNEAARARIPDPNALSTFEASKLRWDERERSPHRERLALIRELLALRRQHLVPRLVPHSTGLRSGGSHRVEGGLLRVEWELGEGSSWRLIANLADLDHAGVADGTAGVAPAGTTSTTIYQRGVQVEDDQALRFAPGGVVVTLVSTVVSTVVGTGVGAHG